MLWYLVKIHRPGGEIEYLETPSTYRGETSTSVISRHAAARFASWEQAIEFIRGIREKNPGLDATFSIEEVSEGYPDGEEGGSDED